MNISIDDYRSLTKPAKRHIPESLVVNACMRWLWNHGCFVWRNNTGAIKPPGSNRPIRFGKVGSPDIIGMTPSGRFIGVECKSGKNGLSEPQEAFRDLILEHNGIHVLAYCIEDLEARAGEILG